MKKLNKHTDKVKKNRAQNNNEWGVVEPSSAES